MTSIIVTLRIPGFHHWPGAPSQVAFLASPHRHIFTFRVEVGVEGDNREVEFFILKSDVNEGVKKLGLMTIYGIDFGSSSCEQLAKLLNLHLDEYNVTAIEVWEDDENGARVTF